MIHLGLRNSPLLRGEVTFGTNKCFLLSSYHIYAVSLSLVVPQYSTSRFLIVYYNCTVYKYTSTVDSMWTQIKNTKIKLALTFIIFPYFFTNSLFQFQVLSSLLSLEFLIQNLGSRRESGLSYRCQEWRRQWLLVISELR